MSDYAFLLSFWLIAIDDPGAALGVVSLVLLLVLCVAVYFLPSIIAKARHHHNQTPIVLVNLFFGWTAIGWIVALIWAFTSPAPNQVVVVNQIGASRQD